jgi:protoporphyrinogen oxidase
MSSSWYLSWYSLLHSTSPALLGSMAAVVVVLIVCLAGLIRLQVKLGRLLRGKNAETLEDSFQQLTTELAGLHQFTKEMKEYLVTVESRLKRSVQGIETIRYNPFKGTGNGGNNSFSMSMLNEQGDGVVLTSMYARDRISVFAKPIKNFASEHELSEEESITSCQKKIKQPEKLQ